MFALLMDRLFPQYDPQQGVLGGHKLERRFLFSQNPQQFLERDSEWLRLGFVAEHHSCGRRENMSQFGTSIGEKESFLEEKRKALCYQKSKGATIPEGSLKENYWGAQNFHSLRDPDLREAAERH